MTNPTPALESAALAWVETLPIRRVKRVENLAALVLKRHNRAELLRWGKRKQVQLRLADGKDPAGIARLAVGHLRHHFTGYPGWNLELEMRFEDHGETPARRRLKVRLLERIALDYPEFEGEFRRQIKTLMKPPKGA